MRPGSNISFRPQPSNQPSSPTPQSIPDPNGLHTRPSPKRISSALGRGGSPAAVPRRPPSSAASAGAARGKGVGPRIVRPHVPSQSAQSQKPRPFFNRSIVFNKPGLGTVGEAGQAGAPSLSSSAQPTNQPAAANPDAIMQVGAEGGAFGSASASAFGPPMPHSDPNTSMVAAPSALPPPSFGGGAFGSMPTPASSAFASSDQPASAFSAFSSPAIVSDVSSQSAAPAPAPAAEPSPLFLSAKSSPNLAPSSDLSAGPATSASTAAKAASAAQLPTALAATTSLSSFLRKDKSNAGSSAASRASTPLGDGTGAFDGQGNALGGIVAVDEDEERKKRFEDGPKAGNRFLQMKGQREALRASYIASGVLPDPNKPTDLALAIKLTGTCQDMCPEFEREEREFQKELDRFEVFPGTTRVDPSVAVKIYRRPAAGRELPLPEDVRPPRVLKKTLDYLFHDLLPSSPEDPAFTAVQPFLWNRTRAIRQDFIVQSESGPTTIECHERIARYHILCLHWKGGPGAEGWSEQQELEQLRKTLRSLIEFYDDRRRSGHTSPNEAEFRAYNLLLHLRDPETLREVELLPRAIFTSAHVQAAISLHSLAQRSNNLERRGQPRNTEATLNFYSRFFAELRKPGVTYLMACLAENSFNSVRVGAIKAMSKAYMAQHRALPLDFLVRCLGLDGEAQAIELLQHLSVELEYEEVASTSQVTGGKLSKTSAINEDRPIPSPFSRTLVEAKRGSFTNQNVVDGVASGSAPPLPLPKDVTRPAAKPRVPPASVSASTSGLEQTHAFGQPSASSTLSAFTSQPASAAGTTSVFNVAGSSSFFQSNSQTQAAASKLSAASPAFVPSFAAPSKKETAPTSLRSSAFGTPSGFLSPAAPSSPALAANAKPRSPFSFGANVSGDDTAPLAATTSHAQASAAFPSLPSGSSAASATTTKRKKSDAALSAVFDKPVSFSASPTRNKSLASGSMAKIDSRPSPVHSSASKTTTKSVLDPETPAENGKTADIAASTKRGKKIPPSAKPALLEQAYNALLRPLLKSSINTAATSAVEAEKRHQARLAGRSALLDSLSEQLFSSLAEQRCEKVSSRQAQHALAVTFEERCYKRFGLQSWRLALGERRTRREMKARLETVRSELKRRGLVKDEESRGDISLGSRKVEGSVGRRQQKLRLLNKAQGNQTLMDTAVDDDQTLCASFLVAQQTREALWEGGVFFSLIAERLEALLSRFCPVELRRFTTLFCGLGEEGEVASQWLRAKFGLVSPEDEEVELTLSNGTGCLLVDASLGADATTDEEDVGLVVFECNPRSVHAAVDERQHIFSRDRQRLERLAAARAVKESALAPRLLVIVWSDGATATSKEMLLQQLGLTSLSAKSAWNRTALLELGDAERDAAQSLAHQLPILLPNLAWNGTFRRTTLAQLTSPLVTIWKETVARFSALLDLLPRPNDAETSLPTLVQGVDRKALRILIALLNHVFRVVLTLSETILEEEQDVVDGADEAVRSGIFIPSSALEEIEAEGGGGLYASSFRLLEIMAVQAADTGTQDEEEEVVASLSHIQASLLASEADNRRFPFTPFVQSLLHHATSRLESVWLGASDEETARSELQSNAEELQDLSNRAVREVAEEVRSAARRARKACSLDDADASTLGMGTKRSIDQSGDSNDRPMTLAELASPSPSKRSRPQGSVPPAGVPSSPHCHVVELTNQDRIAPDALEPALGAVVEEGRNSTDDLKALIARTTRFLDSPRSVARP